MISSISNDSLQCQTQKLRLQFTHKCLTLLIVSDIHNHFTNCGLDEGTIHADRISILRIQRDFRTCLAKLLTNRCLRKQSFQVYSATLQNARMQSLLYIRPSICFSLPAFFTPYKHAPQTHRCKSIIDQRGNILLSSFTSTRPTHFHVSDPPVRSGNVLFSVVSDCVCPFQALTVEGPGMLTRPRHRP